MTPRASATTIGLTCFGVLSALGSLAIASLYSQGVTRVLAAPLSTYPGLRIMASSSTVEVSQHITLNDVEAYLHRSMYYPSSDDQAGTFARLEDGSLRITPRSTAYPSVTLRWTGPTITSIVDSHDRQLTEADLEPETILAVEADGRAPMLQVDVPLEAITGTVLADALIASEDGAFRRHHGIDLRRLPLVWLLGGGASTLTQQVARLDILLDRSRTLTRKMNEIGTAMALERRYSKDEILRAYMNSAYLGTSRGFQIRGFGAAAGEFFGVRDVRSLDAVRAATLVAMLNQPISYLNAVRNGDEAPLKRQRNRVLGLMQRDFPTKYLENAFVEAEAQPITFTSTEAMVQLRDESRYLLDYAAPVMPSLDRGRIETTLDASLQRAANEEVGKGLDAIERQHPGLGSVVQAALVAIRPSTGDIVAMVGGRSYDVSQFNRAVAASRQLGSLAKPFVYLAALERGVEEHRTDLTPGALVVDEPTTFVFDGQPWSPGNYRNAYGGTITWRRALELSRNVAAVKVASLAGFDRVAALWNAASGQQVPPRPSLALGAMEATLIEVARAYAIFANSGIARPLRTVRRAGDDTIGRAVPLSPGHAIAGEAATYAVVDMLRGVMNEGTGAGARAAGFTLDAAGKTGTTNDSRDAWFAGFTPDLLTVVWVGRDDNQPIGLTGGQAALPIWTAFMTRALAGRQPRAFRQPDGVVSVDFDLDTGMLASPACPKPVRQAFVRGTEPKEVCTRHR